MLDKIKNDIIDNFINYTDYELQSFADDLSLHINEFVFDRKTLFISNLIQHFIVEYEFQHTYQNDLKEVLIDLLDGKLRVKMSKVYKPTLEENTVFRYVKSTGLRYCVDFMFEHYLITQDIVKTTNPNSVIQIIENYIQFSEKALKIISDIKLKTNLELTTK